MQKGFEIINIQGCASGIVPVPVIGENGNWYIGNDDTGVKAQGEGGLNAYEIAVQQGFEGSMAEWLESLQGKTPDLAVNLTTQIPESIIITFWRICNLDVLPILCIYGIVWERILFQRMEVLKLQFS